MKQIHRVIGCIAFICSAAAGPAAKTPVPSQADQKAATALVEQTYKAELSKPAPERLALAKKMIVDATKPDSADDVNVRYALLIESRQIATTAGDFTLAAAAINATAAAYDVNQEELKTNLLATARTMRTPAAASSAAPIAFELVDLALAVDDYKGADKYAAIAKELADRSTDPQLMSAARSVVAAARAQGAEFNQVATAQTKLIKTPNDPPANLLVGKWLCFQKDDWSRGAQYLKNCSDAKLSSLADMEVAHPDGPEVEKIADAWWELSEQKGETARTKEAAMYRAAHWYQLAMPTMSGVRAKLAAQRVEQAAMSGSIGAVAYIDDLRETSAEGIVEGGFRLGRHGNLGSDTHGTPVSVGGMKYAHSLGFNATDNATSIITFPLGRRYKLLTGAAALNDSAKGYNVALTYKIVGDGRELWRTKPPKVEFGEMYPFAVDVSKVTTLQLVVDCSGSATGAHVVWLNPKLIMK